MMDQGINEMQTNAPFASNLDAYHQLVELQKQMIKLAQENERVRQQCERLREQMATGAITRKGPGGLRQKTNSLLRKLPSRAAVKSGLVSLIIKEPSTC
jgi:hypothetical protein